MCVYTYIGSVLIYSRRLHTPGNDYYIIGLGFQKANSSAKQLHLTRLTFAAGGSYSCVVSMETPIFSKDSESQTLTIIGKYINMCASVLFAWNARIFLVFDLTINVRVIKKNTRKMKKKNNLRTHKAIRLNSICSVGGIAYAETDTSNFAHPTRTRHANISEWISWSCKYRFVLSEL